MVRITKGDYSSVPSRTSGISPSTQAGFDIELPPLNDDDDSEADEYEYDVYGVQTSNPFKIWVVLFVSVAAVVVLPLAAITRVDHENENEEDPSLDDTSYGIVFPSEVLFGAALSTPYDTRSDFRNEIGNVPPYWEEMEHIVDSKNDASYSDLSSWGPCYPLNEEVKWNEQVVAESPYRYNNNAITYSKAFKDHGKTPQASFYSGNDDISHNKNLAGLCRPGFLIIGQAKCGTSSLYHYLTGHPRVLPAKKKQIDYFKYLSFKPMEWYLSNFPTAQTFLARGALMTGESSPSYFPYPEVPHMIRERTRATGGPHPKIIAILRNPISRSISSYQYSYVVPALKMIMNRSKNTKANNALANVKEGMSEEYYIENHLFSFDELVRAEINVLTECLWCGVAEDMSREKYGPPNGIYSNDYLDPNSPLTLEIADEFCYGEAVSDDVPLLQWAELIQQNPDKMLVGLDYHLIRSIVGRSLYSLFLTAWYARFPKEDIHAICTEDLHFEPSATMLNVSRFLGLPGFDFTNVTDEGMYNVGFNQGYDTVTTWDDIENKTVNEQDSEDQDFANIGYDVSISDELRDELTDFFRPYNEALFELIGKRCQWD